MAEKNSLLPQYQQLVQQIRDDIFDGTYSNKLPSERELAKKYEVSYMTARKAVGILVEQGLLVRSHGQGTFVRDPGRSKDFRSIGLLLPAHAKGGAANPYYAQVIDGACKKSSELNLGMAISDSLETLFDPDNANLRRMADGVIVCPNSCSESDFETLSRFLPVVLIEWDNGKNPAVVIDNYEAIKKAVKHLINLGHKQIAFIKGPEETVRQNAPAVERKRGFIDTMQEAGLEVPEHYLISGDFEFESGIKAAKKLLQLENRPSAIVSANDLMALGAMRYAIESGMKVPEELSITGFDDISASGYVTPGLTTIAPPKAQLGRVAVELLQKTARGKSDKQRKLVLSSEFIIRSSCAAIVGT